jgi:transposase
LCLQGCASPVRCLAFGPRCRVHVLRRLPSPVCAAALRACAMPMRRVGTDMRRRVAELTSFGKPRRFIAEALGLSLSSVARVRRRVESSGEADPAPPVQLGRHRAISSDDVAVSKRTRRRATLTRGLARRSCWSYWRTTPATACSRCEITLLFSGPTSASRRFGGRWIGSACRTRRHAEALASQSAD